MRRNRPKVVSFSGIDGAGKSTQIEALCRLLDGCGCRWKLYTFWDDVAAFSRFREHCSVRLFKGDEGAGSPDRPIERRDKNVSSWPVVLFRLFVYAADALRLRLVLRTAYRANTDVVIFDRFIYDEWANLLFARWAVRIYIRLASRVFRKPDVAILLDADPLAAHRRKPEYPLEFVLRNREAYLSVAHFADMTVIPAGSVEETTQSITTALRACCQDQTELAILSKDNRATPSTKETPTNRSSFLSTTSSH